MNSIGIIGVGASTPLGGSAATTSAACRAAISSISEHPVYLDSQGDRIYVSHDPMLPPTLEWRRRLTALARATISGAIHEVLTVAARAVPELDILVALPEPRPGTILDVEGDLSEEIGALIPTTIAIRQIQFA